MQQRSKEKIEYLMLLIVYISLLCCLARTDYNLAFMFAIYYLWQMKEDQNNSLLILLGTVVTLVTDFLWVLTVSYIWTSDYKKSKVWSSLSGIHAFVIFCSCLNMFLKIVLCVSVGLIRKEQKESEMMQQDGGYQQGGYQQSGGGYQQGGYQQQGYNRNDYT